jgi:hypothetical protein
MQILWMMGKGGITIDIGLKVMARPATMNVMWMMYDVLWMTGMGCM